MSQFEKRFTMLSDLIVDVRSGQTTLHSRVHVLDGERESGGVRRRSVIESDEERAVARQDRQADRSATRRVPRGQRHSQGGEQGASGWSDDGEASDGERSSYPERESVANHDYDRPSMRNVVGVPVFKQTVPKFSGETSNLSVNKHELINFARNEDVDWVLTESGDSSRDVEVGSMDLSVRSLEASYKREVVRANIRVR